jgi:drug/metabolite transporter, DME family
VRSSPQVLALSSAFFSAVATHLIQLGLRRSNFYAAFWINVTVGALGLWCAVLLFVPRETWDWSAVSYFVFSGVVGTAGGRLFRTLAIEKVGAAVAAAVFNLTPLIATGLAVVLLHERVTGPILAGTLIIVAGTLVLSLSGRYGGFQPRHLVYPLIAATCFGIVQIARKLGLSQTGPIFDAAVNTTAAMAAATAFVLATGNWRALRSDGATLLFLIAGGAAENIGVTLLIVALGFGDVSVVTPLIGTSPLFVLLLALLIPGGRRQLGGRVVAATILIVLGVVLLTGAKRF